MSLYADSSASVSVDSISDLSRPNKCAKFTVQVNNGQIRARSNQSLAHDETQPTSTTRHNANLGFERELSQCAFKMHPTPALNNGLGGILAVRWVWNLNAVIGSREFTLMFAGGAFLGEVGGGEDGVFIRVFFVCANGCDGEWAC